MYVSGAYTAHDVSIVEDDVVVAVELAAILTYK